MPAAGSDRHRPHLRRDESLYDRPEKLVRVAEELVAAEGEGSAGTPA